MEILLILLFIKVKILLCFETFEEDDLRRNGFSKDNKCQQPQIVVGLMVTKEGFPISYELFSGNTFEGHTIIPVVKKFINKHAIKNFTVVADAAMISNENITELRAQSINYIVGARLGKLSNKTIEEIDSKIIKEDEQDELLSIPCNYLTPANYTVKLLLNNIVYTTKQLVKVF